MSPQEKMSLLWKRIPRRVFGGRMRTTTVVLCLLWLGLAMLNADLNPPADTATSNPAPAVSDGAPAVPAPQRETERASTSPETSTRTSETEDPATSSSTSSETSRSGQQSGTPTTTPNQGRNTPSSESATKSTTTQPQVPQQSQEPESGTSDEVTTTAPTPQG
ncbi:hypothetical protein A6410_03055 [Prescottella equi]|uniref:hypothetical protein n=1 Tax=Rhodococcus hoagii TaxID=43767 RepID=UPI0009C0D180|nr:hypothetical protein [Prescottella equi]MBM4475223.1 hypothetical protein [Prescottella equi]OQQ32974.1 hypothetical protein A6410_03055 [Prescottella equi]BCN59938.1 hypothetical protein RE9427_33080 [Prescottella equi]